jgi:endonuclease YncB( thermonuclease family)
LASFYRRQRNLKRLLADLIIILVLLVLVTIVYRYAGNNDIISGKAHVIDGDTVLIDSLSIRLIGIDAPERKQNCFKQNQTYPCGAMATRALKKMIGNTNITCHGWQKDIYQRLLATCFSSNLKTDAPSLNQKMVRAGWAVSYDEYIHDEKAARTKKRGIWAGKFQLPLDWRIKNWQSDEVQETLINSVWQWVKNIARL